MTKDAGSSCNPRPWSLGAQAATLCAGQALGSLGDVTGRRPPRVLAHTYARRIGFSEGFEPRSLHFNSLGSSVLAGHQKGVRLHEDLPGPTSAGHTLAPEKTWVQSCCGRLCFQFLLKLVPKRSRRPDSSAPEDRASASTLGYLPGQANSCPRSTSRRGSSLAGLQAPCPAQGTGRAAGLLRGDRESVTQPSPGCPHAGNADTDHRSAGLGCAAKPVLLSVLDPLTLPSGWSWGRRPPCPWYGEGSSG